MDTHSHMHSPLEAYSPPGDLQGKRADWSSGIRFAQARKSLLALQEHDFQFKYWRPFVLFLCTVCFPPPSNLPGPGQ